jgi:hypothetical protein
MNRAEEEVGRIEREIASDLEELTALKIRQARGKEEEIRFFDSLDSESQRALFDSDPEAYEAAMSALARRNERRLLNRNRPGGGI